MVYHRFYLHHIFEVLFLEKICLATRRYFLVSSEVCWEDKRSFTLVVPAARLFSRAVCLAISQALASPRSVPVR